jgi:flagellar biosynthetic protein FliR
MSELATCYHTPLLCFLCVLARVSGLVFLAPLFGSRLAPRLARLLLAVSLALLITPLHLSATLPPLSQPLPIFVMLGREAILGLMLGLPWLVLAGGLQIAGQLLGQISGLAAGEFFDPEFGGDASQLGRLFEIVATASFLLVGGHRQIVAALLDLFTWLPPGQAQWTADALDLLVQILTQSFVLGIRAAAPVLAAVLLATLIVGLMSRVWPQLQAFTVGFNLNALLALALLSCTLGSAAWLYEEHTTAALEALRATLASFAQGGA